MRIHFLSDVFGLLSCGNFATMATWCNDVSSLVSHFPMLTFRGFFELCSLAPNYCQYNRLLYHLTWRLYRNTPDVAKHCFVGLRLCSVKSGKEFWSIHELIPVIPHWTNPISGNCFQTRKRRMNWDEKCSCIGELNFLMGINFRIKVERLGWKINHSISK